MRVTARISTKSKKSPPIRSGTQEVGLFEAKTKLSELVRSVQQGREVVITNRGQAVARLTQVYSEPNAQDIEAKTAEFLAKRIKIKGPIAEVYSWRHEGHRW